MLQFHARIIRLVVFISYYCCHLEIAVLIVDCRTTRPTSHTSLTRHVVVRATSRRRGSWRALGGRSIQWKTWVIWTWQQVKWRREISLQQWISSLPGLSPRCSAYCVCRHLLCQCVYEYTGILTHNEIETIIQTVCTKQVFLCSVIFLLFILCIVYCLLFQCFCTFVRINDNNNWEFHQEWMLDEQRTRLLHCIFRIAVTLLVGRQKGHPVCRNLCHISHRLLFSNIFIKYQSINQSINWRKKIQGDLAYSDSVGRWLLK